MCACPKCQCQQPGKGTCAECLGGNHFYLKVALGDILAELEEAIERIYEHYLAHNQPAKAAEWLLLAERAKQKSKREE
jgi:hypothetical protein